MTTTTIANLQQQGSAMSRALAQPGFDSMEGFESLQRIANVFNRSSLVPDTFRGPGNLPNAIIAIEMALRMRANPLLVLQNLYVVHGRPGWSSQFLIATFNQSGKYTSLRYEFVGEPGTDSYGCRAVTTEIATGEKLVGATITIAMARREGWASKQGSKWNSMPEQMLRYRAAAWLIRAYAPEIAMGLKAVEELQDADAEEQAAHHPKTVTTVEEVAAAPKTTRRRTVKKPAPAPEPVEDAQIPEVAFPDPEPAHAPKEEPQAAPVDYIYELEEQLFDEGVSAKDAIAACRRYDGFDGTDEEIAARLYDNLGLLRSIVEDVKAAQQQ